MFQEFLFPFAILGQSFEWNDLVVVGMLILLEGILSIDNALVLGLLAKRLPPHQRARALSYGLIGAFVFRVLAILLAGFLLQWTMAKLIGGAYLVFIAVKHLFFSSHEQSDDRMVVDADGQPVLVDAATGKDLGREREDLEIAERVPIGAGLVLDQPEEAAPRPAVGKSVPASPSVLPAASGAFWRTVVVIELTDVAFAVDSILAAMALAGSRTSKLWVVIAGGILGVVLMRFAAAIFIRLLERFPRFETSAYLLVIVIGLKLVLDWGCNSDWSFRQTPWLAERLGDWQQPCADFETRRRALADDYWNWLDQSWPLGVAAKHEAGHDKGHGATHESGSGSQAAGDPSAGKHDAGHSEGQGKDQVDGRSPAAEPEAEAAGVSLPVAVPHLLDFHDMRRPESLTFWALMAACFGFGFLPQRKSPGTGH